MLHGPTDGGPSQTSPPVLIGCEGERRFLIPPCSATQPSLLTPADGATGVSPTPLMSWDYQYGDYCEEGIGLAIFTIYYGTDPGNLNQSFSTLDSDQGNLPMLEPYTQYFWRVRVWDDWAYYSGSMINFSETRSFTTAGTVPVERRTWGAVKSIYKD
ncbi:MAG: fibronectin type III domain-containing protein [bacterium]